MRSLDLVKSLLKFTLGTRCKQRDHIVCIVASFKELRERLSDKLLVEKLLGKEGLDVLDQQQFAKNRCDIHTDLVMMVCEVLIALEMDPHLDHEAISSKVKELSKRMDEKREAKDGTRH